jgi:hypothetical protein
MTVRTVWLHKQTSDESDAVQRLLRAVWRWQMRDEEPVSRYTLATVLAEVAAELRTHGDATTTYEELAQRYVDWSGDLNASKSVPSQWEPFPRPVRRRGWLRWRRGKR